jgi:hypothetical protein
MNHSFFFSLLNFHSLVPYCCLKFAVLPVCIYEVLNNLLAIAIMGVSVIV